MHAGKWILALRYGTLSKGKQNATFSFHVFLAIQRGNERFVYSQFALCSYHSRGKLASTKHVDSHDYCDFLFILLETMQSPSGLLYVYTILYSVAVPKSFITIFPTKNYASNIRNGVGSCLCVYVFECAWYHSHSRICHVSTVIRID